MPTNWPTCSKGCPPTPSERITQQAPSRCGPELKPVQSPPKRGAVPCGPVWAQEFNMVWLVLGLVLFLGVHSVAIVSPGGGGPRLAGRGGDARAGERRG